MKSSFFYSAPIVTSAMAVFSFNIALASPQIEERYRNASIVRDIAADFQSQIISPQLKTQLLDSARSEDKEFVKSMIVNWKAQSETQISAEFDELVVRDSEGLEVLRMRALDEPQSFQINGRKWVAPTNGSISKSLRLHLDWLADSARIDSSPKDVAFNPFSSAFFSIRFFFSGFLTSTAAVAQTSVLPNITVAPAYLFTSSSRLLPTSAAEALELKSPEQYVVPETPIGRFIAELMRKVADVDVRIRCDGGTAFGTAELGAKRFQFESREDGKMTFTVPASPDQQADPTKLLVISKTIIPESWVRDRISDVAKFKQTRSEAVAKKILQDFMGKTLPNGDSDEPYRKVRVAINDSSDELMRTLKYAPVISRYIDKIDAFYSTRAGRPIVTEDLMAAKCRDANCKSVTPSDRISSLDPWLTDLERKSIQDALNWRPAMLKSTKARIVESGISDLPSFRIEPDTAKLAKSDRDLANQLMAKATSAALRRHLEVRNMMLSLQPLGSCCKLSTCRASLLGKNLKLVPSEPQPVKK